MRDSVVSLTASSTACSRPTASKPSTGSATLGERDASTLGRLEPARDLPSGAGRQQLRRPGGLRLSTVHRGLVAVPGPVEELHELVLVAHLLLVLRAEGDDLVALAQQRLEDPLPLARVVGVLRVEVGGGVPAGVADGVLGLAALLNSDATTVTTRTPRMTLRDTPVLISTTVTCSPSLMNGTLFSCRACRISFTPMKARIAASP